MTNDGLLVPIAQLALECGLDVPALAERYAEQLLVDDIGLRCLDKPTARALVAEHRAAQQAAAAAQREREAAARAESERAAAQYAAETRAREIRAEAQRRVLAESPNMSALELMVATSNDPNANTAAGRAYDALYFGEKQDPPVYGFMYRFAPHQQEA